MDWEEKNKSSLSFCQSLSLSLYLSKQLQDMAFVLTAVEVVAELDHLKIHLVVSYWGREGNSLAPQTSLEIPRVV